MLSIAKYSQQPYRELWIAISVLINVAVFCADETAGMPAIDPSDDCMASLIHQSGVLNGSNIAKTLESQGVDEEFLARLDFVTANEHLKMYGVRLAVQRLDILKCISPELKELPSSPCSNYRGPCGHGVCRLRNTGNSYDYRCRCNQGFGGRTCRRELNECELNQPCKNNATCEDRVNSFICHCAPGYYGKHCEADRNECASAPCLNGDCNDVINGYQCECHGGYTGELCETELNECTSNPCVHGNCTDRVNSFTCDCEPGYKGPRCQQDINECSSSPCQNFATCHDKINSYTCQCLHGYKGLHCETDSGPLYTRWGRMACPNSSQLVYNGFVAGGHYTHKGSGSNPLCLPNNPIYGRHSDYQWGGILYNAEYELARNAPYNTRFNQHDVPCAVCMATGKIAVFMLPARNICPDGWVREYHGYLMSDHYQHSRTQYVCMDDQIEAIAGSGSNQNGILFYPVGYACSGHCPPYVNAREITCSMCSKP